MWTPEPGDWRRALEPYSMRTGEWITCTQGSPPWHHVRRTHVTATQIRDALGYGYAGSSLASVHAYRRGEAPDLPDEWLLTLGRAAEPALLQWWSRREGVPVTLGGARVAGGVMASLDGTAGPMVPIEAKLRQTWGDDPYRDGGCTPGEAVQLKVQCWVLGAPYGLLVAARGADVHTRLVAHPTAEELAQIDAAVEAIRRADREGWSAVAEWLLSREDWGPYREGGGQPTEPRHVPELATEAAGLVALEEALAARRADVRDHERRRAALYARISKAAGGEAEIDTGAGTLVPVYRAGRLSGWRVRT